MRPAARTALGAVLPALLAAPGALPLAGCGAPESAEDAARPTAARSAAGAAVPGAGGAPLDVHQAALRADPATLAPRVVLLVSIDTLRADHVGAYGYGRPTTPRLDAVAAAGTVFEQALAPSPWTLPSHGSLFTGLYPTRHGLKHFSLKLSPEITTLAEAFSHAGWDTAAVVNNGYLMPVSDEADVLPDTGIAQGFDRYHYVSQRAERVPPTWEITDQAVTWLAEPRTAPLYLFVHYFDPHSDYASLPEYERMFVRPYDGPADGTTQQLKDIAWGRTSLRFTATDVGHLVDLYDAEVRQTDAELGRLFDFLEASGLDERTLLVVTSDHGEEFLDHGKLLHGHTQYDELMRVPLVLRGPGVPAGERVSVPVSLVDVPPTLLSLAGVPAPAGMNGVDLEPLLHDATAAYQRRFLFRPLFGEADHNNAKFDITRAVRYGHYKLHFDRSTFEHALYDLTADPEETRDISDQHPALVSELLAKIRAFDAQPPAAEPVFVPPTVSRAQVEQLQALGYLTWEHQAPLEAPEARDQ